MLDLVALSRVDTGFDTEFGIEFGLLPRTISSPRDIGGETTCSKHNDGYGVKASHRLNIQRKSPIA